MGPHRCAPRLNDIASSNGAPNSIRYRHQELGTNRVADARRRSQHRCVEYNGIVA